jgi:hypothetical protein
MRPIACAPATSCAFRRSVLPSGRRTRSTRQPSNASICRSSTKTRPCWSSTSRKASRCTAAAASVSASSRPCAGSDRRPSFLELAHRLDRETSGILLVGKKRLALTALHDMFREHGAGADKRYLVLVKGRWMNNTQHVKLPLHKYSDRRRRAAGGASTRARHRTRYSACWPAGRR